MESTDSQSERSPGEWVAVAGIVAVAIGPILTMLLDGAFAPMGMFFVGVPLVLVGLVLTRNRWLLLVVIVVSAVFVVGAVRSPVVQFRLTHPAATGYYFVALLQLLGSAIGTVAGLATFVHRVSSQRSTAVNRS